MYLSVSLFRSLLAVGLIYVHPVLRNDDRLQVLLTRLHRIAATALQCDGSSRRTVSGT